MMKEHHNFIAAAAATLNSDYVSWRKPSSDRLLPLKYCAYLRVWVAACLADLEPASRVHLYLGRAALFISYEVKWLLHKVACLVGWLVSWLLMEEKDSHLYSRSDDYATLEWLLARAHSR